jgi:tight adherence protein B
MLGLALLAAAAVGMAVLALFVGIGRNIESSASLRARLDALAPATAIEDAGAEATQEGRQPSPIARGLSRLISGQSFASSVATELARADLPLTVPEYLTLRVVSVCAGYLVILVLSRQPAVAVLGAVIGFFLPRLYLHRRQTKRVIEFQSQLVDVLALLVGALRSGYGMTIALDTVSKQMPSPSSVEFGRVVREIGLGVSSTQALLNLVRRIRSDDLDLIVTAINIQYEVGGNLASILETISGTVRERIRLQAQLRVLTAQPRLQRIILSGLPFALGLIMYLLNPEYLLPLFTPGLTLVIPIAALAFVVIGWVVMGKVSQINA